MDQNRSAMKKELAGVPDRLHERFDFQKIQETPGDGPDGGLRIPEER